MDRPQQYDILSDVEIRYLITAVNHRIDRGWKPQGGIFITPQGTYYQAMVLCDEPDTAVNTLFDSAMVKIAEGSLNSG